jgi:tetratricopeptide (TPR) repeat protein
VDSRLVESIASATDGNPFFVEEMTVHLIDSDMIVPALGGAALRVDPLSMGVPERVRDTLARRLLSLTPDAMQLMSVGSLIGREFDLSVAATASELDRDRLVEAAEDALLSGLVVETRAGRLSFSHALIQHAVYERLSYPRQASIHRRIAEALEVMWERDPSVVADLARHWAAVAAADSTFSATAATWAVRAGDLAMAAAAADEAIARYEQASSLWATTTAGHADALIRLGLALQYRGRADEADERFLRANHLAVALGHAHLQARAAIGLGRRHSYWATDQERIQVLENALSALSDGEGLLRPTIMAMLVTHLIAGFNADEARHRDELATQVRAVATDANVKSEVLLSMGQTRIYDSFDDPSQLSPAAERLAKVADRHTDLRVLAGARFAQAIAALDQGDMAQLRSRCDQYAEVVERLDDPRERSQLSTARSTIAFIEGRYADAAELSDSGLDEGRASGDLNAGLVHYAQGILRAVDAGQAKEVLPLLVDATEYQNIVGFAAGTALCAALAGDHDRALAALNRFAGFGFDGLPRGADWLAPTAFLAQVCTILGAREHASGLYDALSNQPSRCVRVGPLIGWWGPVDHHLGCLCQLLGRFDEAEEHLLRALDLEEQIGARPFAARTLGALSSLVRRRPSIGLGSRAEEPDRADEFMARALALTDALESRGIADEIQSAYPA